MKPAPFGYRRPESLPEAIGLLADLGEDARPLAGGQSLMPLLNMRLSTPRWLVDLAGIPELRRISLQPGLATFGAMCTMTSAERSPALAEANPLLAAVLPQIGHFQIRNRATIGGSLAHLDPAAELPAIALLLGARLELQSTGGTRWVAMEEFVAGPMQSCLETGEIVTAVTVPFEAGAGWGFAEVTRRRGDFALVGAAAVAGPARPPRVVVFGAGPAAQRLFQTEAALAAGGPAMDLARLEPVAAAEIEAGADIHAGRGYRRAVGARLVKRVLADCRRCLDGAMRPEL